MDRNFIKNSSETQFEVYESIWSEIAQANGSYIEVPDIYKKQEFLKWLIDNKDIVLHGSNNGDIEILEPRLANDPSKVSGNLLAVYAVKDPILPIFFAIKDLTHFRGIAKSSVSEDSYSFAVEIAMIENTNAFSNGSIYILDDSSFVQKENDDGSPSGEYISLQPVKPLAKIMVSKDDFPYFDQIKAI